jgi:hypothetical protein
VRRRENKIGKVSTNIEDFVRGEYRRRKSVFKRAVRTEAEKMVGKDADWGEVRI